MSYRNYTLEELIYQYSPREAVAEYQVWQTHWALFSEQARATYDCRLRVPYGSTAGQTLDIFPAREPGSPINVFIHGGFWRFLDSFDHSLVAPAVIDAGGASIQINYDLCPAASLTEVVRQVRVALKWVWEHAEEANGDKNKIYVSGHSAGGHLASMACLTDPLIELGLPRDTVKGAAIVSAMFDLEPILLVPGSGELLISEDEWKFLSPRYTPPDANIDLILAVGGRETTEWIRQTDDMLEILRAQGSRVEFFKPDYDQHYSILFSLGNSRTPLCQAVLRQMKLLG